MNQRPSLGAPNDSAPPETMSQTPNSSIQTSQNSLTLEQSPDALAGAFPKWDLLPPNAFVKRVVRKKTNNTPTL